MIHKLSAALKAFQAQYPKDARCWDAKMASLDVDGAMDQLEGRETDPAKQESALKAIADRPDVARKVKQQAR